MKTVIVGGGPTGIALAWRLATADAKHEVVLLEADRLGGVHSVLRTVAPNGNSTFSEHGPRIYSSSFRQFNKMLDEMNIDHSWVFQPAVADTSADTYMGATKKKVSGFVAAMRGTAAAEVSDVVKSVPDVAAKVADTVVPASETLSKADKASVSAGIGTEDLSVNPSFSRSDLAKLARTYIAYSFGVNYQSTSLLDYLTEGNFSGPCIDFLSRKVLLIDGVDVSRFSVQALMNLINYEGLSTYYKPAVANDKRLFVAIREALILKGVILIMGERCENILTKNGVAYGINTVGVSRGLAVNGGRKILADRVVLALPPHSAAKIPAINISTVPAATAQMDSSGYSIKKQLSVEQQLKMSTSIENPMEIGVNTRGIIGTVLESVGAAAGIGVGAAAGNIFGATYMDYYSVSFMWKNRTRKYDLDASSRTTHGLIHIDTALTLGTEDYDCVVSCGLTLGGKYNGKELSELEDYELIEAVWYNFKQLYPNAPKYDIARRGPSSVGTVSTVGTGYPTISRAATAWKPMAHDCKVGGLFIVGPHTGTQGYGFTSIEAATGAANEFAEKYYDLSSSIWMYFTVNWLIFFILAIVMALFVVYRRWPREVIPSY
tara:strand:+ start:6388 stop:8199 length:1812 start_codon:yes stop_codon:yes gene_type:complete